MPTPHRPSPRWLRWGLLAAIAGPGLTWAAPGLADQVDFAAKVMKAGERSKMSRAPPDVGGVSWSGAATSPAPIKGATVAVMPCPLAYSVCKYLFDSAAAAAKEIGWEAIPIDNKGDPAVAQ